MTAAIRKTKLKLKYFFRIRDCHVTDDKDFDRILKVAFGVVTGSEMIMTEHSWLLFTC